MNLDRVRNIQAIYGNMPDGDTKQEIASHAAEAKGFLAEHFPAMSESDQAMISWYIAEILQGVRECPLKHVGDVLENSALGYAVATVDLLGWGQ